MWTRRAEDAQIAVASHVVPLKSVVCFGEAEGRWGEKLDKKASLENCYRHAVGTLFKVDIQEVNVAIEACDEASRVTTQSTVLVTQPQTCISFLRQQKGFVLAFVPSADTFEVLQIKHISFVYPL